MSRELLLRRQPAARVDRELKRRCRSAPAARRARRRPPARSARGSRWTTSVVVSRRDASRSGSSQTRMLYSPAPKTCALPTPGMRASSSLTRRWAKFDEVQHVVALVGRDEVDDHDEVGRRLLGDDADALHFRRQPRQRLRHAVLHLHLRVVEVGAERERDRSASSGHRRSPARTCRACPRRR